MLQKLAITSVEDVREPEPAVIEIDVMLADNSAAVLRMNVFIAQEIAAQIEAIRG